VVESLKLEAAAGGGLSERSKKTHKREKNKNKKPKKYSGRITYTGRNGRNRPKFWPRWNMGVPRTGLHAGTRFSVRSGRNGTEYTTLLLPPFIKFNKDIP
jgi:hypothetical protein